MTKDELAERDKHNADEDICWLLGISLSTLRAQKPELLESMRRAALEHEFGEVHQLAYQIDLERKMTYYDSMPRMR